MPEETEAPAVEVPETAADDATEPTEAEIQHTNRWKAHLLRGYYRRAAIHLPPRFTRREWGFLLADRKGMMRHLAFATREELGAYLVRHGPEHSYYSTAFYRRPSAPTMNEKGWIGADLIFDLDADHLEGAWELTFEERLDQVKEEAAWVLREFVLGHLGFDEEHVHLVFSGGRGYHIHVTDPRVRDLGSPERREIVDYVTGLGLDMDAVLMTKAYSQDRFGNPERARFLPGPDAPGWRGLLARRFIEFVDELSKLPAEEALAQLQALPGIGPKTAEAVLARAPEWRRTRGLTAGSSAENGGQGIMNVTLFPAAALKAILPQVQLESEGEADEPVTTDTRRLIRLPGSVHGKTGLRVTPVGLHGLDDFDPLSEAVVLGADPVRLRVTRPMVFRLLDEDYDVEPGIQELPEAAAFFLAGQHRAVLAR